MLKNYINKNISHKNVFFKYFYPNEFYGIINNVTFYTFILFYKALFCYLRNS